MNIDDLDDDELDFAPVPEVALPSVDLLLLNVLCRVLSEVVIPLPVSLKLTVRCRARESHVFEVALPRPCCCCCCYLCVARFEETSSLRTRRPCPCCCS